MTSTAHATPCRPCAVALVGLLASLVGCGGGATASGVELCNASVRVLAWHDANGNQVRDPEEDALEGASLRLVRVSGHLKRSCGPVLGPLYHPDECTRHGSTDGQGSFEFIGLCPGEYKVQLVEPLPRGMKPCWAITAVKVHDPNAPVPVDLPSHDASEDVSFSFHAAGQGRIGNLVWHDADHNGLQGANEVGIDGVEVVMTDPCGNEHVTTTSGGGKYSFEDLGGGGYTLSVTSPSCMELTEIGVGNDRAIDSNGQQTTVYVSSTGSVDMTVDWGFRNSGTGVIGDLVWDDIDKNGVQGATEPGLPSIRINLKDEFGRKRTAVTDSTGAYEFAGLCVGRYEIAFDPSSLPSRYVASPTGVGANRAVDSNASPATVDLLRNAMTDRTVDFGFHGPGRGVIGDFVWGDQNGDGLQSRGEPGLPNIRVTLVDPKGKRIDRRTDGYGFYEFTGLCPGEYVVRIDESTLPPCVEPSPCEVGENRNIDSNCSPVTVNLRTNDAQDVSIDFGFRPRGRGVIGDLVWNDLNRNGIQDLPSEPGLPNIQVILATPKGPLVRTTDAQGAYAFDKLCAGTYEVSIDMQTVPQGFVPTRCEVGTNRAIDSNCLPAEVTLKTDDAKDLTIDFGFHEQTVSIGDFVWLDTDCDGIQDTNPLETGIQDVVVELRDATGTKLLKTTTTNSKGKYLFAELPANTYTIRIRETSIPTGLLPSTCGAGTNRAIDSNCSPAKVTVSSTQGDHSIDFGFCKQTTGGGSGCSPGYWKQPHHFKYWPRGYSPTMRFDTVFENAFPNQTLVDVLGNNGGGLTALGRQTVAALLNADTHKNFPITSKKVVELFDQVYPSSTTRYNALKTYFEKMNQDACHH